MRNEGNYAAAPTKISCGLSLKMERATVNILVKPKTVRAIASLDILIRNKTKIGVRRKFTATNTRIILHNMSSRLSE